MKAYKYTTTNVCAVDNRELYFNAPLELGDVLRLLNYHTKYEYSLQRVEVDSSYKVLTIREAMEEIDSIVLHEEHKMYGLPVVDSIRFCGKDITKDNISHQIEIDLSIGDFKEVRENPHLMFTENNVVNSVLAFCIRHNIDVSYNGSRAKLVIPVWNGDSQLLKVEEVGKPIASPYPRKFNLTLREKQYSQTIVTEIKPMSK